MLFHNVICYKNSLLSRIHVYTTTLLNITCTRVVTGVILGRVECCKFVWNGTLFPGGTWWGTSLGTWASSLVLGNGERVLQGWLWRSLLAMSAQAWIWRNPRRTLRFQHIIELPIVVNNLSLKGFIFFVTEKNPSHWGGGGGARARVRARGGLSVARQFWWIHFGVVVFPTRLVFPRSHY